MTSQRIFNVRNAAFAGGAPTDGATDSYAAIQAAINACATATGYGTSFKDGGTVYIPYCAAGYVISQPIAITQTRGIRLVADKGTRINYMGASSALAIIQMECSDNTISGLHIHGTAVTGIRISQTTNMASPSTWITSYNAVEDCEFSGSFTHCISFDVRGSTAGGNDEYHRITRCVFRDYGLNGSRGSGVHIFGGQSHNNRIRNCEFYGSDRGSTKTGVWAEYGAFQHIEGCYFEANQRDILLSDFFISWSIRHNTSRNSSRFAMIGSGYSASPGGGVCECNDVDAGPYLGTNESFDDPYATICYTMPGPINVHGNWVRATNARPMIASAGSEFEGRCGMTIGANVFSGATNYHGDQIRYTTPSYPVNSVIQGCFSARDSYVRYVVDGDSNLYYNNSTGKYEHHQVQQMIASWGMSNDGVDVVPKTLRGWTDFADGGAQSQSAVLRVAEIDVGYIPRVTGIEQLTGTVPDGTVARVSSGKTITDFPIRLSAAPVGWSVRVYWEIERAA